ncbi:22923_t:CDS:2 [Rhizophagus irregularis]|nr:22923_t:CDS:2 [Rhizophagus irregularis]
MAYNSQDTSNSYSQYNNISMPIQPQQGQPKEKIQQSSLELEKRQKKIAQNAHKRKPLTIESERDKQKAELEKSGNELKSLLAQFGTKAKVADDIESDAKRLRSNIEALMAKAQAKVNKAVVHGTFGVEQNTWGISTAVNLIHDFIAEVMNGGRGFGSPSYDGFVPI